MKKAIVLALSLMTAGHVFAAPAELCTNGAATGSGITVSGTRGLYTITPSMFVVTTFEIRCSANVDLAKDENAVALVVGSKSRKGKNVFEGSSVGGSVRAVRACTGGLCDQAGDHNTGLATLLAASTL
ncbi:MAG: hypothetical protein LBD67_06565 [Candidatus Accumulibacter sp.]|jgi:hypothetical protein|nr:hypothetical protein [Accumulibacter sp.]